MNKNSRNELLAEALGFMSLRMELFSDRHEAAEFLLVSHETIAKWERAERKIDKRAWRDLLRLKSEVDTRTTRLSQSVVRHRSTSTREG